MSKLIIRCSCGVAAILGFARLVHAQSGADIDLLGTYTLPSSIAGNGFAGATTSPSGIEGGGLVVEKSQGAAAQEGTFTPFSDLVKPPRTQLADLRGHWMRADVDLGAISTWQSSDSFGLGLGDGGTATPRIRVRFSKVGTTYRAEADSSGGSLLLFTGNGDETQFRIDLSINASNTLANIGIYPLNGSGSPTSTPVAISPILDTVSNTGFFVSGEGASSTRASASVLRMSTNATPDSMSLMSNNPFVKPNQGVSFGLYMSNLRQPVYGFQGFLSISGDPVLSTPSFTGGFYTATPFPLWIINPITATLNVASGTLFGDPPTSLDSRLVDLNFVSGSGDGVASLIFRPNTPPSRFSAGTTSVTPTLLDANRVVVDGTAPSVTIAQLEQNSVVIPLGGVIGKGLLVVSVDAADLGHLGIGSGLSGRPTIRLDYIPYGPSVTDVDFPVTSAVGNRFVGQYYFTPLNPSGMAKIVVAATDRAGNTTTIMESHLVKIIRKSP